ncbi:CHAT domain-containing protein [Scytonema hofmannii FACHB-248]|uniref:CHAT domain-containing protein n=1 Tax=Scytonema hofmannii FACHB-248 TaxID=1842502 RepID=A0ABR8GUF7_9CYAN|nr:MULTISPECIES: CHAT domain-containing tetratricopeptide repeat protein [Nostocales]MBD2606788.1 CHAT domain-containing protein [Scytonema hofmannii FACHB-248]
MKKILTNLLALGIYLTPLTVMLIAQPSWGQTQNPQAQAAEKLLEQAKQKARQQEYKQAISILQQVLVMARELKDQKLEALVLHELGFCYSALGQNQQALSYYNSSLPLSRAVSDRTGEATTLNNIGRVYDDLGQKEKALEFYNFSLTLFRAVGDRTGEATTLNNIGLVYSALGQKQKALEFYNSSLPLRRAVGDRSGEAATLNNIGGVYHDLGQKQKALEFYNSSLPLWRAVGDRSGEARTLNNIGSVYDALGQKQQALSYYNSSLPLRRAVGDRSGEAATLNNIGSVYDALGQKRKALSYYNSSLPLFRAVGDRSGEATTLNNIGRVYDDLGQKQKALEFYNSSLPLRRAVGDRSGEAATLNNIGSVYDALGQKQQALSFYNSSLPLFRAVGDRTGEATTLNNIGRVYDDLGQKQKALEFYNSSLPLWRAVGDRSGEAITLANRGILFQNTNRPTEAIKDLEKSLQIILEMRRGLQQQNRQKFLQQKDWSATALVNVLIEQKKDAQAFEWVNLFTTFELADYNRLINAKVANSEAQQAINQWNQQNQQLESLRQQLQTDDSEALAQKIRQLEAQVYQQAEDISRKFPEVAELFETTPADINKLKSSIPAGTVVIQPVLLTNVNNIPDTLAIFVLTKDKLNIIKNPIKSSEFDKLLTQYLKQIQDDSDADYVETSGKLYDILIRPVENAIKLSDKQVSIIATGKLRYLPFETLKDSKTKQYLIEKYSINYLSRISTRSLDVEKPGISTQAKKAVLAFGNPVPRKPQQLPGAETEVQKIEQLLPGSKAYIRDEATLARFKSQALRFPFLHLATHGCFQNADCKTLNLKNNTLLFADTQFNIADAALLGLQGTELLTLSACQTAVDINAKGQGIAGVAYIFERAGAKAVMASLWAVDDEKTRQLMVDFYQKLNQGMSKGEALRQAKLKLIADHRHPFYWSPFILIGDAR